MDKQQSFDMEKFIESLDDIETTEKEVDELIHLRRACNVATSSMEDLPSFELHMAAELPVVPSGKYSFIGMETFNFKRFIPTQSGDIVCVFEDDDSHKEVAIKVEWLDRFFGSKGVIFKKRILSNTALEEGKRATVELMSRIRNKKEEVNTDAEYGAW